MSRLASFPKALLHEVLKRGPGALEFQPPPRPPTGPKLRALEAEMGAGKLGSWTELWLHTLRTYLPGY